VRAVTRARSIATVAAALVAAVALALPVAAVQSDRFGLMASGTRSKIIYPPGGSPVHDSVVVYNRTHRSITLVLDVIGATPKPDGTYALGSSGEGFAADVHLATEQVQLGPKERQPVGLTIDRPDSTTSGEYAAVTAVEDSAGRSSGLGVTQRLAVLVGITPGSATTGFAGVSSDTLRILLVIIAALLAVGMAIALVTRRRLSERPGR
jgi:hypothetical protein